MPMREHRLCPLHLAYHPPFIATTAPSLESLKYPRSGDSETSSPWTCHSIYIPLRARKSIRLVLHPVGAQLLSHTNGRDSDPPWLLVSVTISVHLLAGVILHPPNKLWFSKHIWIAVCAQHTRTCYQMFTSRLM